MTTQDQINTNLVNLGFDNPSQAALFNKIAESLGDTVDNTLTELSNSENNILTIINSQRYGKSGYYTDKAKAFQFGDDLIVDPVTLDSIYAVIDPTKQIISQAAFEELNSQLFLKVATLNTISGFLVALSPAQLASFTNYFLNFEIPGLPVSIVSAPANILSFNAKATYFATYDFTNLQNNVNNALITFRNSFAFNGTFFTGDLEDYIKTTVPGIRNFFINSTTIDGSPFDGSVSLDAGYFDYINSIFSNITYTAING